MSKKSPKPVDYSVLPSVDELLIGVVDMDLPHVLKKSEARTFIAALRGKLQKQQTVTADGIPKEFRHQLDKISAPLRKVINGSGVIIHTNLGRSPLSTEAYAALSLLRDSYVNLELNLENGRRGNRHDHLRPWIQALCGAENGILVNNNAAAVLLALNSLADKKEVIISRGQLVEIGGSFRIPEILKKAGSKLVEVGTTNRTHPKDHEEAISPRTRLLLWVHSSNYKISGFTKEVGLAEMVELGQKHNIPVMADLGSGALVGIDQFGLLREPLVSEVMAHGVDIVTFSVDKLLGGPQGGIIAGKSELIMKIEKNNLLRALRPDKTQILLTQHALSKFLSETQAPADVPIYRDFQTTEEVLLKRAESIMAQVQNPSLTLNYIETRAQVGSGASPSETLPSMAIQVVHSRLKAHKIAACLRGTTPAIIGRIHEKIFSIDLKAVRAAEDQVISKLLSSLG